MPAELYNSWLENPEGGEAVNNLTYADGKWGNADVLVQPYNSEMSVDANYLLRAYYQPAAPVNLPQTRAANNNYVVLETTKQASADQKVVTGLDNITTGSKRPVYYNLQGMRVSAPDNGQIYIVVRGTTVSKEIYRD